MKTTSVKTFRAEATFGLKRGYSEELISLDEFRNRLEEVQQATATELQVKLSGKVTPCSIVFSGQQEPSVSLSFIQYPKFPYKVERLKKAILRLSELLMQQLEQNRVVLVFDDETLMLEEREDLLDPRIEFGD